MPATMMDIARDLNVSVVTVSKVLRNQGRISDSTRKRVLRRAKQLNYQMNWVARSLVTRRTFTIGLLLPDFTHPFFAEIAKAVASTVRPHGYHVLVSYFEENPALEVSEADSLLARQVDGLIIASVQPLNRVDLFERIQARKVPFILIDRPIEGVHASFVGADNRSIGRLATEHLIEQGCRCVAHLRGPDMGSRRNVCRDTILRWINAVCRCSLATWLQAGTQMRAGITERAGSWNCVQFRMEYFVTTIRLRLGP